MTDNTQLPVPITVGDVIAADDIDGVKYQRVKIVVGEDGVNDGDLSSINPLPVSVNSFPEVQVVSGPLTDAEIRASDLKVTLDGETIVVNNFPATQPVSAVSLPLPSGAATEATIGSSDQLLDELVFILQSILEKMPRVTGNDQMTVSVEAGTLPTVTTCGTVTTCRTVTTVSQLGTRAAMTAADAMIMQGTSHIYNNLVVS